VTDLVEFLRARAAEDEAWAQNPECDQDPDRLLREVEAKRRIIERYERQTAKASESAMEEDRAWTLAPVLLDLALPYVDHEEFKDEWRP
jgi:hypothetical protein